MKAKYVLVALTFALSLAACDKNKHPASDNAADNSTANALNYNRAVPTTTQDPRTQTDISSPGHGPAPEDQQTILSEEAVNADNHPTADDMTDPTKTPSDAD